MPAFLAVLVKVIIGSPAAGITGVLGILGAVVKAVYGATKSRANSISLADIPHVLSVAASVFIGMLGFAGGVFGFGAGAFNLASVALAALASAFVGLATYIQKWRSDGIPPIPKAFIAPGDPNRTS